MITIEQIYNRLKTLSWDMIVIDSSEEENYTFIYGQKGNIKMFFNLFSDDNSVLVNISTPNDKYVIEDNIENSIQRLVEVLKQNNIPN